MKQGFFKKNFELNFLSYSRNMSYSAIQLKQFAKIHATEFSNLGADSNGDFSAPAEKFQPNLRIKSY
jgi:hypothetical protein